MIKFERIWKLIPADWLLSFSLSVSPEKLHELAGSLSCSPKASPSNRSSVTGRKFSMSQFSVFSAQMVSSVPSEAIFFLKTHHLPDHCQVHAGIFPENLETLPTSARFRVVQCTCIQTGWQKWLSLNSFPAVSVNAISSVVCLSQC